MSALTQGPFREAVRSLSSLTCESRGDMKLWLWTAGRGGNISWLNRDLEFVIVAIPLSASVECSEERRRKCENCIGCLHCGRSWEGEEKQVVAARGFVCICACVHVTICNLLPSSLESHAAHITLFVLRNALLSFISVPVYEWKLTQSSSHYSVYSRRHVCGYNACVCVCTCVCVGSVCGGGCGWQKSWHSGRKGDFHWKQTVEAEMWLAGEYPLHSVCISLQYDYELRSACLKWTDTLLQVWQEINDNLFIIFTQDSRTSYTMMKQ